MMTADRMKQLSKQLSRPAAPDAPPSTHELIKEVLREVQEIKRMLAAQPTPPAPAEREQWFTITQIGTEPNADKKAFYFKVFGPPFPKHGVRVWPEVLRAALPSFPSEEELTAAESAAGSKKPAAFYDMAGKLAEVLAELVGKKAFYQLEEGKKFPKKISRIE